MGKNQSGPELLFVPLGGAGEIGMNLYLYGYGGKWIMVDYGITFRDEANPTVEVVMADPSFITDRIDDLEAIVLTHGHEDHLGALPYLWDRLNVPVYATAFTAAFLRRKLRDEGLANNVPIKEVTPRTPFRIGQFEIEYIATTHSIPESHALVIKTPLGTVLHTGDYKFDPNPVIGNVADEEGLKQAGDDGVLAMVGDSTNVFNPGSSGSEGDCLTGLTEVFGKYDGRIAVTCFASNIARMHSIAKAAEANGREVSLVGRSLWRMNEVARESGYLKDIKPFLSDEDGSQLPKSKVVYMITGSQGEPMAALARIAYDAHRNVTLSRGDVVIFSSRVIPGNEKSIIKVENQLARLGVDIVTADLHPVHVSGHPGRQEVEHMYELIRPDIAIPVHGESMHLLEHAHIAETVGVGQVVVNENGGVVRLAPGPVEVVDRVPTGRLTYTGGNMVRLDSKMMRDRKRTVHQGTAFVTVVLDDKDAIDGPPLVTVPGFIEDEATLDQLSDDVTSAVMRLKGKDRSDDDMVKDAARLAVRRAVNASFRMKPVTTVHLIRLF